MFWEWSVRIICRIDRVDSGLAPCRRPRQCQDADAVPSHEGVSHVLFEQRFWRPVGTGQVTVTFRRWKRRQVVAGHRYRTPGGIIEVTALDVVTTADITPRMLGTGGIHR